MKIYQNLLQDILENGTKKENRTGIDTLSVFGRSLRFDLQKGFPIITTKKVHFKSVVGELLWFLSGSTNAKELEDKYGVTIWREWAKKDGSLGEVYGHQWRNFGGKENCFNYIVGLYKMGGFDQISWLVDEIRKNPTSRRLYVTSANPLSRNNQVLDCCHNYFQVVITDNKLNLYFQMRSNDVFLGLPFNIASYALLAHMLAQQTGYEVGELVYSGVDVHLYDNHIEQAKLQLSREPFALPTFKLNKAKDIFSYKPSDFELVDYKHHDVIKGDVAI